MFPIEQELHISAPILADPQVSLEQRTRHIYISHTKYIKDFLILNFFYCKDVIYVLLKHNLLFVSSSLQPYPSLTFPLRILLIFS